MDNRKRNFILMVMTVLVLLSSIFLAKDPLEAKVKATWLWDSARIKDERDRILSFAGENEVNLIYLHIDQKQDFNDYRVFIKEASLSGIHVHALGGDPSWATEVNQTHIAELVNWIEQYNRNVSKGERFKGIHLDIEPYNQDAWETNQRQTIIDGWMASMEYFQTLTKDLKQIETGADLPYWLDEIPISQQQDAPSMSRWMIERLDHVTLMAYRDEGIVKLVQEEIEIANELNKKVIIGIETNPMKEKYTTFYGRSIPYKQAQLEVIESSLKDQTSYYGIAIHDYEGWTQLTLR
ncbi:hypothetical protein G9U52_25765 [Paenibacillus sp. S3N08]|uniref:Uncharacterized protein n=2 Tax=Paenibacillus agricola TaxID=2716264 RepID=A0ABX0JHM6_9BACL|nr:hypothetical protein [Paenibacillus agricola]